MKILKNKKISTITIILLLTFAAIIVALPAATAQLTTKKTFAYIGAWPNPIGAGQETLLHFGITDLVQFPQQGWENLTVTVTKPDGTSQTLGPFRTDTTGGTGTIYVPTRVGTYTLQTHYPEQVCTTKSVGILPGTVMLASDSEKFVLVVTEEPREYYPGFPLPQEYWTRPIDAQMREWSSIAGNWLAQSAWSQRLINRFAPYVEGPMTAHMLWAKPLDEGGLVGADFFATDMYDIGYEHGDAYQGKFLGAVIMNGVLFYNRWYPRSNVLQEVVAVDLHTSEELWCRTLGNNETLDFGQIIYFKSMNMYGAFSYLWTTERGGTPWKAYDPSSGRWEFTITDIPSTSATRFTRTIGPKGEFLIYTVDTENGWMTMWNSTQTVLGTSASWSPWGKTFNATKGIQWNVTIPQGLPGIARLTLEDRIIGSNVDRSHQEPNPAFWGISLAPGQEGQLLFNTTWTLPVVDIHVDMPETGAASLEDGIFIVSAKELRQLYALSLDTGKQLWGPTTPAEPYLNALSSVAYRGEWGQSYVYDGKLFTAGMAGVVNAYDVKTGVHLWTYNISDPYTEAPFGNYWCAPIGFFSGGKIYISHMEHSGNTPLPRGAPTLCLNATTGEEIWRINGLRLSSRSGGQPIIADGVIVALNSYDNRIVALGKGPSAITVSAPDTVQPLGTPVLVKGMVTDISPGTKDAALTMRFPSGVPAVADESMNDWMLYVYQQFPRPTDATGVEVTLETLDPNGNFYEIGRATSSVSGVFGTAFTPQVPGLYKIIATFEGSSSYYGSYAETYINVGEAPTTAQAIGPEPTTPEPTTPEPTEPEPTTPEPTAPELTAPAEAPLITTEVAIIAAVAVACIIGIISFWALKKRK